MRGKNMIVAVDKVDHYISSSSAHLIQESGSIRCHGSLQALSAHPMVLS